jgi:hypothetical protein
VTLRYDDKNAFAQKLNVAIKSMRRFAVVPGENGNP